MTNNSTKSKKLQIALAVCGKKVVKNATDLFIEQVSDIGELAQAVPAVSMQHVREVFTMKAEATNVVVNKAKEAYKVPYLDFKAENGEHWEAGVKPTGESLATLAGLYGIPEKSANVLTTRKNGAKDFIEYKNVFTERLKMKSYRTDITEMLGGAISILIFNTENIIRVVANKVDGFYDPLTSNKVSRSLVEDMKVMYSDYKEYVVCNNTPSENRAKSLDLHLVNHKKSLLDTVEKMADSIDVATCGSMSVFEESLIINDLANGGTGIPMGETSLIDKQYARAGQTPTDGLIAFNVKTFGFFVGDFAVADGIDGKSTPADDGAFLISVDVLKSIFAKHEVILSNTEAMGVLAQCRCALLKGAGLPVLPEHMKAVIPALADLIGKTKDQLKKWTDTGKVKGYLFVAPQLKLTRASIPGLAAKNGLDPKKIKVSTAKTEKGLRTLSAQIQAGKYDGYFIVMGTNRLDALQVVADKNSLKSMFDMNYLFKDGLPLNLMALSAESKKNQKGAGQIMYSAVLDQKYFKKYETEQNNSIIETWEQNRNGGAKTSSSFSENYWKGNGVPVFGWQILDYRSSVNYICKYINTLSKQIDEQEHFNVSGNLDMITADPAALAGVNVLEKGEVYIAGHPDCDAEFALNRYPKSNPKVRTLVKNVTLEEILRRINAMNIAQSLKKFLKDTYSSKKDGVMIVNAIDPELPHRNNGWDYDGDHAQNIKDKDYLAAIKCWNDDPVPYKSGKNTAKKLFDKKNGFRESVMAQFNNGNDSVGVITHQMTSLMAAKDYCDKSVVAANIFVNGYSDIAMNTGKDYGVSNSSGKEYEPVIDTETIVEPKTLRFIRKEMKDSQLIYNPYMGIKIDGVINNFKSFAVDGGKGADGGQGLTIDSVKTGDQVINILTKFGQLFVAASTKKLSFEVKHIIPEEDNAEQQETMEIVFKIGNKALDEYEFQKSSKDDGGSIVWKNFEPDLEFFANCDTAHVSAQCLRFRAKEKASEFKMLLLDPLFILKCKGLLTLKNLAEPELKALQEKDLADRYNHILEPEQKNMEFIEVAKWTKKMYWDTAHADMFSVLPNLVAMTRHIGRKMGLSANELYSNLYEACLWKDKPMGERTNPDGVADFFDRFAFEGMLNALASKDAKDGTHCNMATLLDAEEDTPVFRQRVFAHKDTTIVNNGYINFVGFDESRPDHGKLSHSEGGNFFVEDRNFNGVARVTVEGKNVFASIPMAQYCEDGLRRAANINELPIALEIKPEKVSDELLVRIELAIESDVPGDGLRILMKQEYLSLTLGVTLNGKTEKVALVSPWATPGYENAREGVLFKVLGNKEIKNAVTYTANKAGGNVMNSIIICGNISLCENTVVATSIEHEKW